jgi:hypothetical protein
VGCTSVELGLPVLTRRRGFLKIFYIGGGV